MTLKKLRKSLALQASAAAITAAFATPLFAADTTATDNAVNMLMPFTTLNSTAIGQETLYANLFGAQGTVGINNTATAAQRQQAVFDNYVLYISGQTWALADGLGTKAYSAIKADNASLTNLSALMSAVSGVTGAHSSVAKTFFGNGNTTATTATLPSNGTYGVYDAYYSTIVSPFASTNSAGNSRPFQVLGFDSTSHPSIDSFSAEYTGPTVTVGTTTITQNSTVSNVAIATTDGGVGVTTNAAAPSGHTTYGYTEAILYAMLVPERYLEMLTRGSEYGNSRLVLGVHYPLDVIMGRALASYDIAQMMNNTAAYTSGGTVNYQTLFANASAELRAELATACGGVANCTSDTGRFSNAAQNKKDYADRLTYGLPTLSFAQAPREAAPTGGPDASILLATVYGGSTAAAKALANAVGGPSVADLTTNTINQIIVNTETNAIAAFYGTSLSYWTRINLYDAASYFDNISTGTLITAAGDTIFQSVTVSSGGAFGGSGTVNGNLTVQNGGSLAAQGNGTTSYAGLTVGGTGALQAGSTIQLAGVFLPGTKYTLLTTAGALTVDPSVVIDASASGNLMTLYSGQWTNSNSQLQINLQSHFANAAQTQNQQSVASAIDAAGNAGNFGAGGATFLNDLIANNTVATAPATFASLSGEGLTGQQTAALNAGNLFVTTVLGQATFWADDRSNDIYGMKDGGSKDGPACSMKDGYQCAIVSRARLWAAGFGQYASLDGQGSHGSANQSSDNSGVATGIDYEVSPGVILGLTGGYSNATFSVSDLGTKGTVEGGYIGGYGVGHYGSFYLAGTIDYANFDNKANRFVTGLGVIGLEKAAFSSNEFIARFEGGYKYETGSVTVTPFAGFQVATLSNDSFSETGFGGAGLNVNSQDVDSDRSIVGLQLSAKTVFNGWSLTPYARASWEHEFNPDRSLTASFQALPAAQFTVYGAGAAEDLAHVNAGFKLDVTQNISAFAAFDGEFSDRGESYAGTGGLRIRW